MKPFLLALSVFLFTPFAFAEKCTGKDPCTACKDCTQCAWCAKSGNSCGTMRDQNGAAQKARDTKRAKQKKVPEKK